MVLDALSRARVGRRRGRRGRRATSSTPTRRTSSARCASPPATSSRACARRAARSTRCCTRWTAATSTPARRARRRAGASTSCRPGATSTGSTRRRCRRSCRGTSACGSATRCWSDMSRKTAAIPRPSGSSSGARPRCARTATTSPRSCTCSASGRSGTRTRGGSRASRWCRLEELGRPRIDVVVRISGFFRDAFPHLVSLIDDAVTTVAALDESDDDNYVRKHVRADAERLADELGERGAWRRSTARVFGSRAGLLRRRAAGADRRAQLARRRRPRRGLRGVGRARLRRGPGRRGGARRGPRLLRADRGRGQEHRQPRARPLRLRRLLPVPRRDGRGGARAERPRPEGVGRRQRRPGARPRAVAGRGGAARLPRPRDQPALDRRDGRATATRARSSWRRPSTTCSATTPRPASSTTGCTRRSATSTSATRTSARS